MPRANNVNEKPASLLKKSWRSVVLVRVPLTEFESVTFCSASKRSIQLRYRGI